MDKKLLRLIEPGFRLYLIVMFIFTAASAFWDLRLFLAELLVFIIIVISFYVQNKRKKREIVKYFETAILNAETFSNSGLLSFPLPMAIVKLDSSNIVWCNSHFLEMTGDRPHVFDIRISDIIEGFDLKWIIDGKEEYPGGQTIAGRQYRVLGSMTRAADSGVSGMLAILYWIDSTELSELRRETADNKVVFAEIICDNYEDITKNVTDAARSAMAAALDEKLTVWSKPSGGILRRVDRDRYILIITEQAFRAYAEAKFDILEDVKKIVSENGIPLTISVGIGRDGGNMTEIQRLAALAADMALSRGGDQVVVRNKFNFDFYGGRTKEFEKRTRIKARITASVFARLIKDCSNLLIMGHKMADIDSLGAAAGLACAARKLGREAFIIIDAEKNNAGGILRLLSAEEKYSGVFISGEEAMLRGNSNSLLVVVDTNRPNYVENEPLLHSCNRVAVIDHHRRAADYIENAALNVHEPAASSTCEIVAELLQYIVDTNDILHSEAASMLAGIALDTKNFTLKTGVRTFEAAAFLRRAGADTLEVKRLFQDDFDNFLKKSELMRMAHFYKDNCAVVKYPEDIERTVAAGAADELLNIIGVQATFVICYSGGQTIISARSLGRVNVQLILEKLGGGGHLTMAGAQLEGKDADAAYSALTTAIDEYTDEAV